MLRYLTLFGLKLNFTENGLWAHSPKLAFLLLGEKPKLDGEHFFLLSLPYGDEPNFSRNHPPRHSVKVKSNSGESEFMLDR